MKKNEPKKEDHPFYCYRLQKRRSAWDTPEFLTQADWDFIAKIIDVLKTGDGNALYNVLWRADSGLTKRFFYQSIGWPEGWTYCSEYDYVVKTAFGNLKRHELPRLNEALTAHVLRELKKVK